tara:strand:+ start:458 stop:589 length:132 start_codon:yes stop_codon:yes gene_type:complete
MSNTPLFLKFCLELKAIYPKHQNDIQKQNKSNPISVTPVLIKN